MREGVGQRARSVDPRLLLGHALLPVDVVLDRGACLHTVAHGGALNAGTPLSKPKNVKLATGVKSNGGVTTHGFAYSRDASFYTFQGN